MENENGIESCSYHTFFHYLSFREGQEQVIKSISLSQVKKGHFLLIAPNGTGKTITSLCSILPLAYEKNLKVIYLCRTNSQNRRIIDELKNISSYLSDNSKKLHLNAISIRGRKDMCINDQLKDQKLEPEDSMNLCERLRKNDACRPFINLTTKDGFEGDPFTIAPQFHGKPIDAEEIKSFCIKKKICPYFFCKSLMKESKIIICNYQWLVNPNIRPFFFWYIQAVLGSCICIFDECHNLLDVCCDVNSTKLTPRSLSYCINELNFLDVNIHKQIIAKISDFIKILDDHFKKKNKQLVSEQEVVIKDRYYLLNHICDQLKLRNLEEFQEFLNKLLRWGEFIQEIKQEKEVYSNNYIGALVKFWIKWFKCLELKSFFYGYTVRTKKKNRYISLTISALDPREISVPILTKCYSSVHLSGTVTAEVYKNLMGFEKSGKEYNHAEMETPFNINQYSAFITWGVTSQYKYRDEKMYKKIIAKVEEVVKYTPKNVGVFCASYNIIKGLRKYGIEKMLLRYKDNIFIEESGNNASENALLLEDFKSMATRSNKGGVLLGVCGGRNAEGEDFPGDYMNSVVIVGIPYMNPTPKVKAKISYYGSIFPSHGWDYAYLFPAMLRANQAAGRPIRRLEDKGAIFLMDWRFFEQKKWISSWILKNLNEVEDRDGEISNFLTQLW